MDARQFKLFQQITVDYFAKLAPGEALRLDEPFLHFGELALEAYTSLVEIRGRYDGCLFLTSPRPMLGELLAINGEREISDATLRDMCRELANVLAGNASKAFGGDWQISVPISFETAQMPSGRLPSSTFLLPIHWRGTHTLLGIGLTEPAP
jgi:hypothetical protein